MAKHLIFIFQILFVYCLGNIVLAEESKSINRTSDIQQRSCDGVDDDSNENVERILSLWIDSGGHKSLEQYQNNISQLEAEFGVYGMNLVSELLGVGLLLKEENKHSEAANAFKRALYIIRVNEGLYSISQIPILDLMLASYSADLNWQEVANNYDFIQWLYGRNYAEDDPRLLPILKRLWNWHLEAYNKETGYSLEQHFKVMEDISAQAVEILENCSGDLAQIVCSWHRACCTDALPEFGQCPVELK